MMLMAAGSFIKLNRPKMQPAINNKVKAMPKYLEKHKRCFNC